MLDASGLEDSLVNFRNRDAKEDLFQSACMETSSSRGGLKFSTQLIYVRERDRPL